MAYISDGSEDKDRKYPRIDMGRDFQPFYNVIYSDKAFNEPVYDSEKGIILSLGARQGSFNDGVWDYNIDATIIDEATGEPISEATVHGVKEQDGKYTSSPAIIDAAFSATTDALDQWQTQKLDAEADRRYKDVSIILEHGTENPDGSVTTTIAPNDTITLQTGKLNNGVYDTVTVSRNSDGNESHWKIKNVEEELLVDRQHEMVTALLDRSENMPKLTIGEAIANIRDNELVDHYKKAYGNDAPGM